mmetsp:Transcript_90758/g.256273  ORF Transcript_90758/g.256273 Transcript_90758/m.256273 type:complete len:423 (-) Transcript_90758:54-1322(-)
MVYGVVLGAFFAAALALICPWRRIFYGAAPWKVASSDNLQRAAELSHRLLTAGLTVPERGTPGSLGRDGIPSLFGAAAWAAPAALLAAREALRGGRMVVIRQFLDPQAAGSMRNEVGRLFTSHGDWQRVSAGNWSGVDPLAFESWFRGTLAHADGGFDCDDLHQWLNFSGGRPLRQHEEHALPGSPGSAAAAQSGGAVAPVLGALSRVWHGEEMGSLVAWLFDRDTCQDGALPPVTWELKATRWRPKRHWAAAHRDTRLPRGGTAGARRFAALTLHLCDQDSGQGGALVWCRPRVRVPCAFNQLVLFGLEDEPMHAVEPVIPRTVQGAASSRWTLQAWASSPNAAAQMAGVTANDHQRLSAESGHGFSSWTSMTSANFVTRLVDAAFAFAVQQALGTSGTAATFSPGVPMEKAGKKQPLVIG